MDPLSRKLLKELEEMQERTGRMLRNMSMARMLSLDSGNWQPAADIYESEGEYYVYFDLAGADSQSFSVVVDGHHLRVQGRRQLPAQKTIACIHQLEIELGPFDRTVTLPGAVNIDAVTSAYVNGILTVTLPKKPARDKIDIEIALGEE